MTRFSPTASQSVDRGRDFVPLALILVAAIAIRLYAFKVTAVINPDAAYYIQQARAMAVRDWLAAVSSLPFLSSYSLLIYLAHALCADWLTAAHAVSLTFGTLALLPLYGLLRQLLPRAESLAATAVLAFLPTWVVNSVDIVRDPVAWFFALSGLSWLARGLREPKKSLLPLACLAFLLAAWARIECLYFPVACLLLPLVVRRRGAMLPWFYLPLLIAAGMLALSPLRVKGSLLSASRLHDLMATVASGVSQYSEVRSLLRGLIANQHDNNLLLSCFLTESRQVVWLVGLGTIANRLCEALTYPFTLITLAGIGPLLRQGRDRALSRFFCLLAAGALTLLYIRALQIWVIEYRYMMLAILPATPCLAAGMGSLANRLAARWGMDRHTVLAAIALVLILSALPKDLQPRGNDEVALKEIGQFLDHYHPLGQEITLASSANTSRIVRLYANRHRGVSRPLAERQDHLYPAILGDSVAELIATLRREKIDYLLWEERNRPATWPAELEGGVVEIGRWQNHQTGTIIVYRVTGPEE